MTEALSKEIVDEPSMPERLFDVSQLPRRVQIGDVTHAPDAFNEAIARAWRAQCFGPAREHHGFNDWRLQRSWSVERLISGEVRVSDDQGRTRALIVETWRGADPVMVMLPRYYVNLEQTDAGEIRAVAFDRHIPARIRLSAPLWPRSSAAACAELRADYEAWLEEIRPNHADPFLYW
ncbi:hypothetical protein [Pandoraea anhela]|uniref:Uncharacterized protein n=1 Tax=Pandoraea anhela TaxID=2508295 RepID=A0A5E4S8I0_9BURK|nr:hypothetical protein [Pandoraea anhela]VVD70874.1 hypothetical protein PAN31108_00620 [Pandoraea anhela]